MFGAVYAADGSAIDVLIDVAREFSPRIETNGARAVTIDLSGLTRLFGDARAMGAELLRTAAERGLRVRVAIAGTRTAARLLACAAGRPLTVIDPGTEPAALAPLPLVVLAHVVKDLNGTGPKNGNSPRNGNDPNGPNDPNDPNDLVLTTLHRWGLRTLGDLAGLPSDAVAARLGQEGVRWQRLARGEDPRPLLPEVPEERFEQAIDLEWPIEGLEPLSFVLGRLMDPLSAHLERRGRGAAVLHVRLHLVTRVVHERSLQLPAAMRDARTLRTLALLDLESHPPAAAIDRVVVAVDPTPARVLQFSLLTRPLPSPEQISTLMARLTALLGEGRCGSPAAVDAWQPGAFAMNAFGPRDASVIHPDRPQRLRGTEPDLLHTVHGGEHKSKGLDGLCASVPPWPVTVIGTSSAPAVALRRFRVPVPARVRVEQGRPWRVVADRRGVSSGGVTQCAGPWRTAGNWWTEKAWDRDEWDVTLSDGATYRVFRDRSTDAWFLEGIVD
jgi:protein ImuB